MKSKLVEMDGKRMETWGTLVKMNRKLVEMDG